MINVADTILTQYADSPKLKSLIYSFNEAVGIEGFLDDFYDVIWNIETAEHLRCGPFISASTKHLQSLRSLMTHNLLTRHLFTLANF